MVPPRNNQTIPVFQKPAPVPIEITFKLKDCDFMEFKNTFDLNSSTIYDLMYSIAEKHGKTIPTDKINLFIKKGENDFVLINNVSQQITSNHTEYYYDYNPVSGSLLIIPNSSH